MGIRFYNGRILTLKDGDFSITNGEVHTMGNLIDYVGSDYIGDKEFTREIDLKGNLIMPSFKNAHTHSSMTLFRSLADDLPLKEWLNKQVFPLESKLEDKHIYYFNILAIMEYLSSGITSNFDMYMRPDIVAKSSKDCGFRTVLCSSLNDFRSNIHEVEEEYNRLNSFDPLISYRFGFHAQYTCSDKLLKDLSTLAKKYNAPVSAHNSETKGEVQSCIDATGFTPTKYLDNIGIFDNGGTSFHGVFLTEEDKKIFKDKNIYLITNPASNSKLASGIAPINEYFNYGIKIGIGTDSAGSNNALDMFREMYLISVLQKLKEEDAKAISPYDILNMATKTSGYSMGLFNADTIEVGKLADLIVIDLDKPNMRPINNICKNLIYSGNKINIKLTMVNGNILYENGKYTTIDEMVIYRICEKLKEEIKYE